MSTMFRKTLGRATAQIAAVAVALLALMPVTPALAYVGPGAGLTAIGTVLALVAALLLAIVGFVWYPIRRLRRRRHDGQPKNLENETRDAR